MRILTVFGTRPEAIKMAPVMRRAGARDPGRSRPLVCVTGQHREMLDQVLELFGIRADHDLDLMRPGQTLDRRHRRGAGAARRGAAQRDAPGPACWCRATPPRPWPARWPRSTAGVPVGHVEAGLRTGDAHQPFPEEMNRRLIDAAGRAALRADRRTARGNLLREGVRGRAHRASPATRSIDALLETLARRPIRRGAALVATLPTARPGQAADPASPATGARTSAAGWSEWRAACAASPTAATWRSSIPVHLNPNVQQAAHAVLGERIRAIHLIAPLDYLPFVAPDAPRRPHRSPTPAACRRRRRRSASRCW